MRSHPHDLQGGLYRSEPTATHEAGRELNPSLLPLIGVVIYLTTGMFYILPSGNPQPADLALLTAIIGTVMCVWRRFPSEPLLYLSAFMFLGWIVLINSIWFLLIGNSVFMTKSMFYVFNMLIFFFGVSLYYHDAPRLKSVVYWSLIVAAIIQVVYLELFAAGATARAVGTFNNPNQLGYWGLLILACFAVVKERQPLGFVDIGFLLCAAYAVMRSLSKAASISGALLILMIIVFCRFKQGSGKVLGFIFVTVLVAEVASGGYFGIFDSFTSTDSVAKLEKRLSGIGEQKDDDVMTRGYYRIIDNVHLMAFGAGEAAFARLDRHGDPKEFHSTLGNLLVSYGLVGIGVFFFLLFLIFMKAHISSLAYFVPLMLYGVTHNGIRDTLLWFFLALVFGQSRYGSNSGRSWLSLFQRRPVAYRTATSPPHYLRPPGR